MSEFHDQELRTVLWQASGDDCDTADAMQRVEARVRRIRRRRMDVVGATLLAAALVTLGIASRSDGRSSPDSPTAPATTAPITTTAPPTTTATTLAPSEPVTTPPSIADPAPPAAAAPPPDTAAVETPTEDTAVDTGPPAEPPTDEAVAETRPPTRAAPAAVAQTFSAPGGRLTVAIADGALTIVAATPGPGFTVDAHDGNGSHVEVTFGSRYGSSRIQVDLVDGRPRPTITFEKNESAATTDGDRDRWPSRSGDYSDRRYGDNRDEDARDGSRRG